MTFPWCMIALIAQGVMLDIMLRKIDDPWAEGETRMRRAIGFVATVILFLIVDLAVAIHLVVQHVQVR